MAVVEDAVRGERRKPCRSETRAARNALLLQSAVVSAGPFGPSSRRPRRTGPVALCPAGRRGYARRPRGDRPGAGRRLPACGPRKRRLYAAVRRKGLRSRTFACGEPRLRLQCLGVAPARRLAGDRRGPQPLSLVGGDLPGSQPLRPLPDARQHAAACRRRSRERLRQRVPAGGLGLAAHSRDDGAQNPDGADEGRYPERRHRVGLRGDAPLRRGLRRRRQPQGPRRGVRDGTPRARQIQRFVAGAQVVVFLRQPHRLYGFRHRKQGRGRCAYDAVPEFSGGRGRSARRERRGGDAVPLPGRTCRRRRPARQPAQRLLRAER